VKLNDPVPVKMRDFVLNGIFDCIELGQTKEWILNNFPDPDDWDGNLGWEIWRYGLFEFHFTGNILDAIFCDSFYEFATGEWSLNAGPSIVVEPWVFADPSKMGLVDVIRTLIRESADFSVNNKLSLGYVAVNIRRSGVELGFAPSDEDEPDAGAYQFGWFSLKK